MFSTLAQTGAGTIQGTVTDANGAIVPGAKVTLKQVTTQITKDLLTNDSGIFLSPSVTAGKYTISVEATGMSKWEGELDLLTGQNASIQINLAPAGVSAEVTVAGDVTELVKTNSATISTTLDRQRLEQLPQNGRSVVNLIGLTTPTVEITSNGGRVNGMRESAFEVLQDGAPLVNRDFGGVASRLPGVDSVQEVSIETSGSSAKFNRPATAILTTKSGANRIFGSIFETHRNNSLGLARRREDFFTNGQAPKLIRNEFGGSVGGPIVLPRFGEGVPFFWNGQNKAFFFVAYEGFELREQQTYQYRVPTVAMRNGDFSNIIDTQGRRTVIYDPLTTSPTAPYTRTPFPNNQIPLSRISPLAKALYAVTPLPTNNNNPFLDINWIGGIPNFSSQKTFTGRLDYNIDAANQVFFRYSYGSRNSYARGPNGSFGPPTTDGNASITYTPANSQSGTLSFTHTFSPSFFSETVLSHNYENSANLTGANPNVAYSTLFGLPNIFGEAGFPNISGSFSGYGQNDNTRQNFQNVSNLDENLTYLRGKQEFQFGGRYRRENLAILADQNPPSVSVGFNNLDTALYSPSLSGTQPTATALTGNSNASFFLGYASSYTVAKRQQYYHFLDQEISTYFQDNYRVNNRLTLNMGVRWEMHPALRERDNFFTGFDFNNKSVVIGQPLEKLYELGVTAPEFVRTFTNLGVKFETPEQAGLPKGLVNPNWFDITPRFGVAYKLSGDTRPVVVRGGYAIFAYPPPVRNFYAETRFNPPYTLNLSRSFTDAAQNPTANYDLISVPNFIAGLNTANVVTTTGATNVTRGSFMVSSLDPDYPTTKVHQWNTTIEKEFFNGIVGSVNYSGSHGTNLEQYYEYNSSPNDYIWYVRTGTALPTGAFANVARRPFDNLTYGSIEQQRKTGYSNAHAFTIQAQRRFKNGYGFQVFYVLTNALRAGGNGWRDQYVSPYSNYLAGFAPENEEERNRFINYRRDTDIPKHRIRWNWIADLPIGKGKMLFDTSNKFFNAVFGGWQFAGIGNIRSTYWGLSTANWNLGEVEIYKKPIKIQDCRTGNCYDGYLWYNGYIPANQINSVDANGRPNGVMGVPSDYVPAHKPLIPYGAPVSSFPCGQTNTANFWDTNQVGVQIKNAAGATVCQTVTYNPGYHPWAKSYFLRPFNWTLDSSLYKTFKLSETMKISVNIDVFNVFNMPGLNAPDGGTGIASARNSFNSPRQIQFTGRFSW